MSKYLENKIHGEINADEIVIGKGVIVEKGVVITGKNGSANKIVLGDFCYIGHNSRIIVPEFRLGDYSKLHASSFCHGEKKLQIGRNCWIGGNTILDSMGGLDIDDNVGIGGQSQLWTHIQFGDIVEGSRFYSKKYMHVGRDAWLVGHCIISPVSIGEKSMALVGSVVTSDMKPNHIYAGVPAKDVSDKMGYQFEIKTVEQKFLKLQEILDEFFSDYPEHRNNIKVVYSDSEVDKDITCINVSDRTYNKTYSDAEISFLKKYTPLVKLFPRNEDPFVVPQYHQQ